MLRKIPSQAGIAGFIISLGRNILMFLTHLKKIILVGSGCIVRHLACFFSLEGKENIMFLHISTCIYNFKAVSDPLLWLK